MSESEDGVVIDPLEDIWAQPPASVSWDVTPPFEVSGLIVKQEIAQQTEFNAGKPGKPLTWDDGRPRKKVIITIHGKPDEDSTDDDGLRALHVKIPSGLFASIRDAIKEAGMKTLPVHGTHYLSVTYTGDAAQTAAEKRAKLNPTKEFVSLISDSLEPPF